VSNELGQFDWRLTTFEGARREQLRRWAALPLEQTIRALEEMEEMSEWLAQMPSSSPDASEPTP
jgi:hypothetical protein